MKNLKPKASDADALAEMRKRYSRASDLSKTLYDQARDDIKFVTVPGNQWDAELKRRRRNRPTYEFPKLRMHAQQVINEMRQQRPAGKVRGTEESDVGLAEIIQGLCRNIESVSNADRAYDIAFEKAVKGGFGCWRITTDYLNDDDFEQDIIVKPVRNPFAVKFDPAALEIDRRDAMWVFVEELMHRGEFEGRFPDASVEDFDSDNDCADWREANQVRIAEYWYKEPMKRTLLALADGRTVFADDIAEEAGISESEVPAFLMQNGAQVIKTRQADSHKVFMRLTNGHEWLTEPHEFPCKFIPIVPVWGNIENIDGEEYWSGMVRFGKDQQRLHNVHRSALIEAVAKAPKAPYIVDPAWIKGFEQMWKEANAEDRPFLYANINSNGGNMPKRVEQAQVPSALIQLAGMDNDDLKAATGIYDASLGARSNETTGIAINSRKQQGATATYNYIDNLAYAIQYTYEIMVDMIPRIYDTPRVVRIIGEDGGEKWKQLYQQVVDPQTGNTVIINDIKRGKYDVTVTTGPSYATQRMEAMDAFMQLAQQLGGSAPMIAPLLAYAAMNNADLPGMEETIAAFRKILVNQGLLQPKDGEQPPAPPQPNPMQQAQVQKTIAEANKNQAQAQRTQVETQNMQMQHLVAPPPPPMHPPVQPPPQIPMYPRFDPNQPPQGGFFMPGEPGSPSGL